MDRRRFEQQMATAAQCRLLPSTLPICWLLPWAYSIRLKFSLPHLLEHPFGDSFVSLALFQVP
jgi:hypothetical protein